MDKKKGVISEWRDGLISAKHGGIAKTDPKDIKDYEDFIAKNPKAKFYPPLDEETKE